MQELERIKRRKKKSVLTKLAGGSNQSSPRCLAGSLDSTGNDRASQSDDYGLEGLRGSDKLRIDPVSKRHSLLDEAEAGLGELNDDDAADVGHKWQNVAAAKKNGLDNLDGLDDENYDDDDDDNYDDDAVDRRRPGSAGGLTKNDPSDPVEYVSPSLSPTQQQQLQPVNGGHDISDPEDDEEASEYEEADATEADTYDDRKSIPSTSAVAVLNARHFTDGKEDNPSKVNPPQAEIASSSTFTSSMMKLFGFNTRSKATLQSSVVSGSVSSLSNTMTKMSTKDARNRFVVF